MDVIRKIRNNVKKEGVGHNYLIQHTTGSGKSYSIGWLSHLLVSLYQKDGDTQFFMDAREGFTYVIKKEETIIEPKPDKKYSLYGED